MSAGQIVKLRQRMVANRHRNPSADI